MKITVIGPVYPYRGGIAHFTTNLVRAITPHHSLQVISFKRQYPGILYPGRSDRDPSSQPITTVDAQYLLDPLYPWTWIRSIDVISQFRPDTIVIQWWTTFWSPAFAFIARVLKSKGYRVIFLIHNVLPHETRIWDRTLAWLTLSQSNRFIVQTPREKERLVDLLPQAKLEICPHPIYDQYTSDRLDRKTALERLSLPPDQPVILFFGIVRPYKGLSVLLDAARQLRLQGEPFFLVVAGEFWEPESRYLEQIQRYGLQDQVRLVNQYIPDEDVPAYFSAAEIFVAPYLNSTQSGAVKLAMGFGIPIVVSDVLYQDVMMARSPFCHSFPSENSTVLAQIIKDVLHGKSNMPHLVEPGQAGWDVLLQMIERVGNA